jgi:hypothetical protein
VQLAPAQNPCVQTSRRKPFQRAKRIGASKVYRARSFDFFVKEQEKGTRSQICEDGGTKRHLTSHDLAAGRISSFEKILKLQFKIELMLQFRHSTNGRN